MLRHRIDLFGPFGMFDSAGRRIELTSKRGMALMALLATARGGIRARGWVQDMLWGSRAPAQAQASVRRELSNLRSVLNSGSEPLLDARFGRIALDLDQIDVSVAGPDRVNFSKDSISPAKRDSRIGYARSVARRVRPQASCHDHRAPAYRTRPRTAFCNPQRWRSCPLPT